MFAKRLLLIAAIAILLAVPARAPRAEALDFPAVMEWVEAHRDTKPSFSPDEIVTGADIDRLRPFLPPAFLDNFDFPEFQAQRDSSMSPSRWRKYCASKR